MSLMDLFRGKKRDNPSPPNIPVDRDDSGERIYYEDIVAEIKNELERRRSERAGLELQWTLNTNFNAGNQNCDIDIHRRTICEVDPLAAGEPERRVYNLVAPLMETRHANLGSVQYDMIVKARSPEADDWEKARISTKLLEYVKSVTDFDAKMEKLISWAELCGTAFTLSWWNADLGEKVGYAVEGIIDPRTKMMVEREIPIMSGNIDFGLLSAFEVFPHSLTIEEIGDQHDIIVERVLDVGEIYDLYGRKYDGQDIEGYVLTPLPDAVSGHGTTAAAVGVAKETRPNCERVIMYIENPSRAYPKGRLITVIRDEIVYYGELPAGINPLVAMKSKPVVGQFFGKSVIQDLIPLQRSYNEIQNKIQDFIQTVANNPWLVPEGSIEDVDELAEQGISSGTIIVFNPDRGKPEIVEYPSPPSIMETHSKEIEEAMYRTAGVSQLMVYGAAAATSSGKALQTRQEIDTTRMSLTADSYRGAVLKTGGIWLRLNKEFSDGYRVIRIAGDDESGAVYTWCSEDINSFDVDYTAENELRHSRDKQREDFTVAYNMGLLMGEDGRIERQYIERGRELFDIEGSSGAYTQAELQRKNACRENSYIESGVIPERGRYDDDEVHLDEHTKYALTAEYRLLAKRVPEYIRKFDEHIEEHLAAVQKRMMQAQAAAMQQAAIQTQQKG